MIPTEIRPCRECGGSDFPTQPTTNTVVHCGRCLNMPKLHPRPIDRNKTLLHSNAWDRGWFKPDPDTVVRWCFEHGSGLRPTNEACDWAIARGDDGCEIGWIAKPTRLEVME